jgi:hypothetical protein
LDLEVEKPERTALPAAGCEQTLDSKLSNADNAPGAPPEKKSIVLEPKVQILAVDATRSESEKQKTELSTGTNSRPMSARSSSRPPSATLKSQASAGDVIGRDLRKLHGLSDEARARVIEKRVAQVNADKARMADKRRTTALEVCAPAPPTPSQA